MCFLPKRWQAGLELWFTRTSRQQSIKHVDAQIWWCLRQLNNLSIGLVMCVSQFYDDFIIDEMLFINYNPSLISCSPTALPLKEGTIHSEQNIQVVGCWIADEVPDAAPMKSFLTQYI